jgi:hypothetical protein
MVGQSHTPPPTGKYDQPRAAVAIVLILVAYIEAPAAAMAVSIAGRCNIRRSDYSAPLALFTPPPSPAVVVGRRSTCRKSTGRAEFSMSLGRDRHDQDGLPARVDAVPRHTWLNPTPRRRYVSGSRMAGGTTTTTKTKRPHSSAPVFAIIATFFLPLLLASGYAHAAITIGGGGASPPFVVPYSSSAYHLTRILFLRLLAVVYVSAFSVAKFQNKGLVGDDGITPARVVLDRAEERGMAKSTRRKEWLEGSEGDRRKRAGFLARIGFGLLESSPITAFRDKFWHRTDSMDRPLISLLWLARDRSNLNPWLDGIANAGLALSLLVLFSGCANFPIMLGLWLLQRTLMSSGGTFYGYGWEPQLAELTFHALFLVPMMRMDPFLGPPGGSVPGLTRMAYQVPMLVILAIRFYLFKIMLGAGLIKLRSSDAKWKPGNMSAMDYFYETQASYSYHSVWWRQRLSCIWRLNHSRN